MLGRAQLTLRRHSHFVTWPPSWPARPHPPPPGTETPLRYGWGDWFVASVVSSFVAWPVVFATDYAWGEHLLPAFGASASNGTPETLDEFGASASNGTPETLDESSDTGAIGIISMASLVPKAAGSFLGAHLYVPHAWWFWKLTLLPALPLSFALSMAIHCASEQLSGSADHDVSGKNAEVANTAWKPATCTSKSMATRAREAAPTPVQLVLLRLR